MFAARVDRGFRRKIFGDVKHSAAAWAEDQLIPRVKFVVNVGDQVHVAGAAGIFLAPPIRLEQGAHRFAFVALGKSLERIALLCRDSRCRFIARGAERIHFGLQGIERLAHLLAHRCEPGLLDFGQRGHLLHFGLELFDGFHLLEQLIFHLAAIHLLGVDLDEKGLIFLVVLGHLLLRAKALDSRIARFHFQLELRRRRLLLAKVGLSCLEFFVEVGDFAVLQTDVLPGGIEPPLGFAELLIGLE